MINDANLEGCRVLVVEDEGMLSMLLQDLLGDLGCVVVGTAARLDEAAQKSESLDYDIALLDINLHGEHVFPVAEALHARGKPFVLASGYASTALPAALRDAPLLQKPYRRGDLATALWDARHGG